MEARTNGDPRPGQGCLFCGWSGVDEENSYEGSGPTYYSMGEPPHIEPCICQFGDVRYSRVPLADWEWELLRSALPDEDY